MWGVLLMGRRNHRNNDWHHRVPDFKLVYCGPKKSPSEEENKHVPEKRMVKVSVTTDIDGAAVNKLEKPK